jgi:EAL domain-containing protein (putative c-di-GMP-specific phosphodiesterase class I)
MLIDLKTGDVVGVEALTRFVAEPGATPDAWFADAASVGLGTQMELLAVQTALTAAAELPEHLYVSVNVSPSTCLDLGLAALITECPIAAIRIVIEPGHHQRARHRPRPARVVRRRGLLRRPNGHESHRRRHREPRGADDRNRSGHGRSTGLPTRPTLDRTS